MVHAKSGQNLSSAVLLQQLQLFEAESLPLYCCTLNVLYLTCCRSGQCCVLVGAPEKVLGSPLA